MEVGQTTERERGENAHPKKKNASLVEETTQLKEQLTQKDE